METLIIAVFGIDAATLTHSCPWTLFRDTYTLTVNHEIAWALMG